MWVLAWVESGCCVGVISMGWARCGLCGRWRGVGFRAQTNTHLHLPACQSVSMSGLVPQTVILSTITTTTVQLCLSGLRTHEPRTPGAQPSSIASFSAAVLRAPRAPIAKAKDRSDGSTGQRVASPFIILLQEAQQCPPIPSSLPLETDDICAT